MDFKCFCIGVPVTNILEVKRFLDESGSSCFCDVSIIRIIGCHEYRYEWFDLVIADEAHRCAGKVSMLLDLY